MSVSTRPLAVEPVAMRQRPALWHSFSGTPRRIPPSGSVLTISVSGFANRSIVRQARFRPL